MGWWKSRGTEDVIGDLPLDTLAAARRQVIADYQAAFGRRPTIREWERLLGLVLGHDEERNRCSDEGVPAEVKLVLKRYFKRDAESELGVGTAYIEISEGGYPSRQVEIYRDRWRWGNAAHREHLADQPLEVLDLGDEHAISAEEFERVWLEALTRPRT